MSWVLFVRPVPFVLCAHATRFERHVGRCGAALAMFCWRATRLARHTPHEKERAWRVAKTADSDRPLARGPTSRLSSEDCLSLYYVLYRRQPRSSTQYCMIDCIRTVCLAVSPVRSRALERRVPTSHVRLQ